MTTLEEVFLRVGHGDDTMDDKEAIDKLKNAENQEKSIVDEDYTIAETHEKGVCNTFFIHLRALFLKRFWTYKRNYKGFIVEVFIPVLLVLIGFGFSKIQFFFDSPERPLVPSLFPLKQRIIVNTDLVNKSGNDFTPMEIINLLPDLDTAFDVTYKNYSSVPTNTAIGD